MLFKPCAAKPSVTNLSTALMMMAVVMLSGCAGSAGSSTGTQRLGSKVQACRAGDEMVRSSGQCLQDGAACYELTNGNWCTGERGNTCPAGSTQLPKGSACPRGARCIAYGEDLNCAIQFSG